MTVKPKYWVILPLLLISTVVGFSLNGERVFFEQDGLVSMESENASRMEWEIVVNQDSTGGKYVANPGTKDRNLVFNIKIETPGKWYVWFRHCKPANDGGDNNDCIVTVNGNEVVGMGTHQKRFAFQSRPKSHHEKDRALRPYFEVKTPGIYAFVVNSRSNHSKNYMIDKIILLLEDKGGNEAVPDLIGDLQGFGPPETMKVVGN